MKFARIASLAALALSLCTGVAQAALYTDYNSHNDYVSPGNSAGGTFDIAQEGYNPSTEIITSAVAKFALRDDRNDCWYEPEVGLIKVGGDAVAGFLKLTNSWSITIGEQIVGSLLTDLAVDGKLTYKVVSLLGDFTLKGASLCVETRSVPDGGTTLLLLGAGLIGLAGLRRKLA